ncbi:DHA1 family bicyclomycin/chloramphenicol resistance-like MFS transporter [Saccharopolyspora erythraea NRRL 2338]|uniref:Multidrug resistance transporter, MFS superfamily n=2 Tax=Saccharopolyspora erythraea TaxID=1836 RepID=A4FER6_SACEN|nr:multidrug effflux MFS transporter [Saccharopolyspora erythraea]EQD83198.1 transporter [Saccharopolyspora erythraea D]PFG96266.1 DHA1 family bicyclomycin/chloramphenicol resistance-like MFS transporter [Saccharopolyspora erythraea NRRL 2338]QRK92786.1 multidrug effflux MFS transporter [Saccharopolyspora erythraea]CAM02541.1 multidrug resistance transporter, MFS superfamily [Saccharopolyspora erythraea NRRL 2338]
MNHATLDAESTPPRAEQATSAASRLERVRVIVVLGALVALGPLTIDMYLPALPAIGDDLLTTSSAVQLTLTGTLLGLGLGQLLVGPFSDAVGRRLPLILGTVLHIASSLLCIVAPNIAVLGLLRALQGVGAAATMVVALAVVRDLYSGRAAATALSRLMLVMGAAPILAPTLGGAILLTGSWRGVFAALAVLGGILLLVAIFALDETLPPQRRLPGEVRPVLRAYRTLLTDGKFMIMALVAALGMSGLFSYVSGSSFVLQEQFGLDQQEFALVFGAGAVALIGASQLNVVLLNRWTERQIVLSSLAAATAFGVVLVALTTTGTGGLLGFILPLWFLLGAFGFVLPNAPALALSRHGETAGTAAALLGAGQFGLGALIAPLVGLLGNDGPAMALTMTGGSAVALLALGAMLRHERRTGAVEAV